MRTFGGGGGGGGGGARRAGLGRLAGAPSANPASARRATACACCCSRCVSCRFGLEERDLSEPLPRPLSYRPRVSMWLVSMSSKSSFEEPRDAQSLSSLYGSPMLLDAGGRGPVAPSPPRGRRRGVPRREVWLLQLTVHERVIPPHVHYRATCRVAVACICQSWASYLSPCSSPKLADASSKRGRPSDDAACLSRRDHGLSCTPTCSLPVLHGRLQANDRSLQAPR